MPLTASMKLGGSLQNNYETLLVRQAFKYNPPTQMFILPSVILVQVSENKRS